MPRRPVSAALEQDISFQGQPLALHHLSTSRCPFLAATAQVSSYHGHPLDLHHWRVSRCPSQAAKEHVRSVHSQPLIRAHLITSRLPPQAAKATVSPFQLQPFARHHWRTFKHPPIAAAEHTCGCDGRMLVVGLLFLILLAMPVSLVVIEHQNTNAAKIVVNKSVGGGDCYARGKQMNANEMPKTTRRRVLEVGTPHIGRPQPRQCPWGVHERSMYKRCSTECNTCDHNDYC